MSFGGEPDRSFLNSLVGRSATFLFDDRRTNIGFARSVTRLLADAGASCTILDLDALYSSNASAVLEAFSDRPETSAVVVPAPGSDIEEHVSRLFGVRTGVIIIDSLNSLYHLISTQDGISKGRKLFFALACLSNLARTNKKAVIVGMYRREGFGRSATSKSVSNLTDITASVEIRNETLEVSVQRGFAWPGGRFSSRIP